METIGAIILGFSIFGIIGYAFVTFLKILTEFIDCKNGRRL